jgi:hypothetical protein
MPIDDARPIRLVLTTCNEASSCLRDLVRRTGGHAETAAGYVVACALWGLIVYVAFVSALR